jgi:hypothetical protein
MWPFKRRREQQELRALFKKHLADEVADELLKNPRRLRLETHRADISFILLQVRDDPVDQAQAHMAHAMDIIMRRGGWCDVMSSLALSVFGLPVSEDVEKSNDQRAKSVARLVTELGANIRLVHGTTEGLIGNYGSPERFHYGPLLPGFARYLTALTSLEFGQSAEVRPT